MSIIPWRLTCLALAAFTVAEHTQAFAFLEPLTPEAPAAVEAPVPERAPDAGLKVFITDDWAQRRSDAEPAPPATPAEIAVAESGWSAQVGAFRERDSAAAALAKVGKDLTAAQTAIDGGPDGYFRARFTGLSRDGAEALCQRLQARAQGCIAVARVS